MFDMLTSPYTHPLKRLIWMRLKAGARAVWDTISGNPVSFTAKAAPLRQLEVAFSPVQAGSGDPSPDNVRPISGWTSLTINQSGANLVVETADWVRKNNPSIVLPSTITDGVWTLTNAESVGRTVILPCGTLKAGSYTAAITAVSSGSVSLMASGTNTRLALLSGNQPVRQITLSEDTEVNFEATVSPNTTLTIENLMLNLGNEAKPYQPYNPLSRSISISLGSTVYSGTVDVVTGVGEVTMASVDLGTLTWRESRSDTLFRTPKRSDMKAFSNSEKANWLCSNYRTVRGGDFNYSYDCIIGMSNASNISVRDTAYSDSDAATFKAAMSGVQLVYELATPIPIQLTPQEVNSLAGDNVLFSDANGDLTVTYRSN